MKIYSLPVVSSSIAKNNNHVLKNEEDSSISGVSDETLKSFSHSGMNFYSTKKLKPNVTLEKSKLFLSKMQSWDKEISQGGSFGPIPISMDEEQVCTGWGITELKKIKYFLTVDKTEDNKNIYTFTKQYESPQGKRTSERMQCILSNNGRMIQGFLSTSEKFGQEYNLSFDRNNKNKGPRRLILGDKYGTTTYAPTRDSEIWAPVAQSSIGSQSVLYNIKSVFKELFMELAKAYVSIKAE